MMITNELFLEERTADGQPIGWISTARRFWSTVASRPNITSRAQGTPRWSNGRAEIEGEIPLKLQRDAHLIVVAIGENANLSKGWGRSWESSMRPTACTNPIYVDLGGKGFQPNGGTLGHPILTAKR